MTSIKMFPAQNGDAFLINIGKHNTINILIDGGFSSTYQNSIKPALQTLKENNFKLNLAITTHIDADHINGMVSLLVDNGHSERPNIIEIQNFWHNSLRSITGSVSSEHGYSETNKQILKKISNLGYPQNENEKKEISAKKGSALALLLKENNYRWNRAEGFQTVTKDNTPHFDISDEVCIQVLSPTNTVLASLKEKWIKDLKRKGFSANTDNLDFDDGFEFMLAREKVIMSNKLISSNRSDKLADIYIPDTSITNRSSISILITDANKKLLFLADSWSEDIEESLIEKFGENLTIFDVIKISHHGSFRNTSPKLLTLIDSPRYLISTNGKKHNHPDIPLIRAIVERPCDFTRQLLFSEKIPKIEAIKKLQEEYDFEIIEQANEWINM